MQVGHLPTTASTGAPHRVSAGATVQTTFTGIPVAHIPHVTPQQRTPRQPDTPSSQHTDLTLTAPNSTLQHATEAQAGLPMMPHF